MIELKFKDTTAKVAPECGMNTFSLRFGEEKILREPVCIEALRALPNVFGTPLLLPPGRVPDGKFSFEGKDYQLVLNDIDGHCHIHGLLSCSEFKISEQTENTVKGIFENDGRMYPFPYRVEEKCTLDADGYTQEITITNTGSGNMPLAFGLHTCFEARDYIKLPLAGKMSRGKVLELDPFGARLAAGGCLKEGEDIDDSYLLGGRDLQIGEHHYLLSENFIHTTVWNYDTKSGFIAVEPQMGTANALNNGCGLKILPAGSSIYFRTQIV